MKYMMQSINRTILVALVTRNRFIVSLHLHVSTAFLRWRASSSRDGTRRLAIALFGAAFCCAAS